MKFNLTKTLPAFILGALLLGSCSSSNNNANGPSNQYVKASLSINSTSNIPFDPNPDTDGGYSILLGTPDANGLKSLTVYSHQTIGNKEYTLSIDGLIHNGTGTYHYDINNLGNEGAGLTVYITPVGSLNGPTFSSHSQGNIIVNITKYDGGIMEGVFSGNLKDFNNEGDVMDVKDGKFRLKYFE